MSLGFFIGVGVGPGPAGYLSVAALEALRQAQIIYLPRARSADDSVAKLCLAELAIDESRFRDVEFNMEADEGEMVDRYACLADQIGQELEQGKTVAYLTIGDAMTYSTYIYLLKALQARYPALPHRTYAGITSYAAAASALDWPLGEGKERVLILPCPDEAESLRQDIETHDVVVLMKIGKRLPMVLDVLRAMGILHLCAFARRLGLPGELVCADLQHLPADAQGYLATMLIRKTERRKRTG